MAKTIMLGMWDDGKFVYKKRKAETNVSQNCYGNWLRYIIAGREEHVKNWKKSKK